MGLYLDHKAGCSSRMGVRDAGNFFYIDDILLMVESKQKLQDQSAGLIYLLQCLGFTINQEKIELEPCQSLVFLGFTVDMSKIKLSLPLDKIKNQSRSSKIAWGGACLGPLTFTTSGENECKTEVIHTPRASVLSPSTHGPNCRPQVSCSRL